MHYPDSLQNFDNGLSLYVPVPELIKPAYEQLLAKHPGSPFPYWAQVWPSAKAMVAFLLEDPSLIKNKSVLELGAGIGLPSFSIAPIARRVTVSDYADDAVELLGKNIRHTGFDNVKAACIDWNDFPYDTGAEVVLLSDVNYVPGEFEVLLNLVRKQLDRGATLILSTPQRITSTAFIDIVKTHIQKTVLLPVEHGGQLIDIRILVLHL